MKRESKYSMMGNILYIIRKSWKNCKQAILLAALSVPFSVTLPLLTTFLLSKMIEYVTRKASAEQTLMMITVLMLFILIDTFALHIINSSLPRYSLLNRTKMGMEIKESVSKTDYMNLEDSEYIKAKNNAQQAVGNNASIAESIFDKISVFAANVIGVTAYSALIIRLSPMIALILILSAVILYSVGRTNARWIQNNKSNWYELDRKISYVFNSLGSVKNAKDVRLYGMTKWFTDIYGGLLKERGSWTCKYELRSGLGDLITAIVTLLRDGLTYGFLIYKISEGRLSAAEFVFYFTLVGQYSAYIFGIMNGYVDLYRSSLCVSDVRDFLGYKCVMNHREGERIFGQAPQIAFEHVSFQFPNSDKKVLEDVSFVIQPGEKVAIVGLNGAGKTTLVKLICGLFIPTEGRILVNGKEIKQYNIEEYYSAISAAFQDIYTLPMSIEENIAGYCADIDSERMEKALLDSGLTPKINSLKDGSKTKIGKYLYADATDLSGGEQQKLAIARVIYKKAPIVILDEPTAALDPVAESNIYQIYRSVSKNATSVFVSHRLASTRFCDRIFLLENGKIAETGNHDVLMEKEGRYAEMFRIQSQYYEEDFAAEE